LATQKVEELYHIGKRLGEGKYGVVRVVEKKNYDKIRFAMKEINIEQDWVQFLQREYDILKILDHPFIMNLVEVYYSKKDSKM
jgi:serine/threonine protein kinase